MKTLPPLLCLILLPLMAHAGQSEISARMKSLADGLVTSYRAKHPAAAKEKVAVFEFSSTKELRERHIGHAVAELLTHHVNGDSGFVLVERLELNKILEELKLRMSGIADQEDALKAGKLSGAKAVVLGSVEKLGNKYHVNARMVDVETGEVAATAYEAMPVHVFEAEAKDYIVLVPETQRIGLYTLFSWRHNPNNVAFNQGRTLISNPPEINGTEGAVYPDPFDMGFAGFGVRYTPSKRLILDLAYMANTTTPKAGRIRKINSACLQYYNDACFDEPYSITVKAYRGLLSYPVDLGGKFVAYFGVGATHYHVLKDDYVTPTAQLRGEYFLQERIGLSLSTTCDVINKTITSFGVFEQKKRKLARLSQFYVESSISMYF